MCNKKSVNRIKTAAALLGLVSVPAMAQEGNTSAPAGIVLEEIIVVGTQIEGAETVGSIPVAVSRDDAVRTGLASTADILRRLPQNQVGIGGDIGFQGGTANQGYNGAQMETINLRGLGPAATLILVDGRRVVGAGGASTATDANQVPVRALERLEVLTDGASAVYGSDAVAGVVNFVLRKDFEGVEATIRADNASGGDQYGGSLIAGNVWDNLGSWGRGNVLVTYEYLDRESFRAGKIKRLRQDLRPVGGPDMRVDGFNAAVGFSPNIISQTGFNQTLLRAQNYNYWGVPYGDGTGLASADLALNNPNLVDFADYEDWTGEQQRHQAAIYFNQELTETVELFANLTYTDRETVSRSSALPVRIPLFGTPYFIPDLPVSPEELVTQQVQYSTLKDGQVRTFSAEAETIGAVLGMRMELAGGWNSEAYINYGRNEQCDSCVTGTINSQALIAQVQAGNINPLSSLPLTPEQASLVYGSSRFESRTTLEQIAVKFNGPLFSLPAGEVLSAVGVEYRTETNANRNISRTGPTNELTQISSYSNSEFERDITSAFFELNIPVTEDVTVSAAVRYDDYSDFGSTTNPKLGVVWNVTDEFRLMGSWGTSFRAPSVTDVNPNAVSSGTPMQVPNYDPRITNGVFPPGFQGLPFGMANAAVLLGSNPDLMPEEADTWSVTANYRQGGFDIGLTYWNIKYEDQILYPGSIVGYIGAGPGDVPANGGNYGGWGSLITPINNPASCDNSDISTADPALQAVLGSVNYDFVSGGGDYSTISTLQNEFCQVNVLIDSRVQNIGTVEKTGIDFNTSYSFAIDRVDLIAGLALTHFLDNDLTALPGGQAENLIGDISEPNSVFEWSGTANLTALWQGFDATLTARYLDSMKASAQLDANGLTGGEDRNLSSYTQYDLTLGYSADYRQSRFGLEGWRAQFVINNLTDELPDLSVTSEGGWNFKYGLPMGRTYALELTARF